MKRKGKKKRNIIILLTGVFSFFVFLTTLFFGFNTKVVRAARSTTDWVTVDEIYDETIKKFDAKQIKTLFQYLVGSTNYEDVKKASKEGKTSSDFRTLNGGKNIELTFGGFKWDAVYLTQASNKDETDNGDIILDLWRSTDELHKTIDEAVFSTWKGSNQPSLTYPASMYSTSSVRVVTLNAGGKYSNLGGETLSEVQTKSSENKYAKFTMEGIEGSLTSFIAKPIDVGYQENEWDEETSSSINSGKYYLPNDAYGTQLTGGQWRGGYNFGEAIRDETRDEMAKYDSWKNDYIWLPSISEAGIEDANDTKKGDGIWDTDSSLRSAPSDFTTSGPWLRSGKSDNSGQIYLLKVDGNSQTSDSSSSRCIRPALHLNLTKASQSMGVKKLENDSKPYEPNGVTWNLDVYADLVNFTPIESTIEGVEGTSWWNSETHTITAPKIGEYKLKASLAGEDLTWSDGTKGEIEVTYTVTKALLEAKFRDTTYTTNLQRLRETVYRVLDDPIKFKLPDYDTEGDLYPIYHKGTETKVGGLNFKYHVEYHDESSHDQFASQRDATLEELKTKEDSWKTFDQLELQSPDKPGGFCVFFKATDPNGNYEDYYDWFGIHVAKEELQITITEGAKQAYQKGETYGYKFGDRAGLRTGLIESIEHIYLVSGEEPYVDKKEDLMKDGNLDNFHFYLRTADGGGGQRYDFGTNTFLTNNSQEVKYLPVGEYYLYIYYNAKGAQGPDAQNDGFISFAWEGERPHFSVSKRKLSVTANDTTITYGDKLKGSGVTYGKVEGIEESGFAEGEDYTYLKGTLTYTSSDYTQYSDVGDYTITPAGLESNNYEFVYKDGTLNVEQKQLTVIINGAEDQEYSDNIEITAELSGVVNQDDVDVELKVTRGEGVLVGNKFIGKTDVEYEITAQLTGSKAKNYTLEDEGRTATFTISKAIINKPTGSDKEVEYNSENQNIEITGFDSTKMDYEISGDATFNEDTGVFEAKNAETYTITFTPKEGYQWGESQEGPVTITLKITQKEIGVTWSTGSYTYIGEVLDNPTATATGVGDDGELSLTVTTSDNGGVFKDAGTYTFTATLDNGNYKITNNTKEYNVEKASLEITWKEQSFTYNGQVQEIENPTATGLGEDKLTITATTTKDFKDAGTYEFTASLENNNYEITNPTNDYTIDPFKLTLNWSENDYTYNGNVQNSPTAKAEGVNSEQLTINVSTDDGEFKNAGEYTFKASLDNKNYEITNDTEKYNIKKASLTIVWKEQTFEYTGSTQFIENPTATGLGEDQLTITATTSEEFKNAKTYTFTASLDNNNYEITNLTHNYTINPFKLTLNWSENDYTYNGNVQNSPTAKAEGVNSEQLTINVSTDDGEFKNAGEYTFKASLDNKNYEITNDTEKYNIKKASLTIVWKEQSFTYNGQVQTIEDPTATGLGEDQLTITATTSEEFKNAKTYTFTASLDNNNYEISNLTHDYTINPFKLALNWSENDYTYNGNVQNSPTAKAEGVNSEQLTINVSTDDGEFKNAGEYTFKASLDNKNYEITNDTEKYNIKKAPLTIVWKEQSFTYNGQVQTIEDPTATGLGEDKLTITSTTTKDFKDAGTYEFTASLENNNYEITNLTHNYTINPFKLTLNWSENDYTYNGNIQNSPTAKAEGVNSEQLTINVSTDDGEFKNAGEYTFKASLDNKNYEITNDTEKYNIKKAPLTIVWKEQSFTYNGEIQSVLKPTTKGIDGDEINITISSDKEFKNAGEYVFTATIDNPNYKIDKGEQKTYKINKADISFSLDSDSSEYDGKEVDINVTFDGLKGDTLVEGVDYKVEVSGKGTSNGKPLDEGTYTVTVTLLDSENASNYNLTNSSATYTINPSSLPNNPQDDDVSNETNATSFILLFASQFIIAFAALFFIRGRRKVRRG